MDMAITKLSSRGQVVIPAEMREDMCIGEKLVLIKSDDQFIIKKVKDFDKTLEKDLEFARETEEELKKINSRERRKLSYDEFIEEMELDEDLNNELKR